MPDRIAVMKAIRTELVKGGEDIFIDRNPENYGRTSANFHLFRNLIEQICQLAEPIKIKEV